MSLIEALFNRTFNVSRRDRFSDGQGGWPRVWAAIGTVRGRLRPMSGSERILADQEQRYVTHVLYTLTGEDIARGDQVDGAGKLLDVLGVREPSHSGHHYEIDLAERVQETALAGVTS